MSANGIFSRFIVGLAESFDLRRSLDRAIFIWGALLITTTTQAQTVSILGTPHLAGLDVAPTSEQVTHSVEVLSAFMPTQICVERMSGERIEVMLADPAGRGATFRRPELAHRRLASNIIPIGIKMQIRLGLSSREARQQVREPGEHWDKLETRQRLQIIAHQLAGFEFHSAVLNWSYLSDAAKSDATTVLSPEAIEELDAALTSRNEVYALAVPLARRAGLHELCTADSLEDETSGMAAAIEHGGQKILESPAAQDSIDELLSTNARAWRPDADVTAFTSMLRYYNSDEFTEVDRRLQWDLLKKLDNEAGAFSRRLMYWHARTSEISVELFRALAKGPDERVLLIIGAAHRPFTEESLRSQPWVKVTPAIMFLDPNESRKHDGK